MKKKTNSEKTLFDWLADITYKKTPIDKIKEEDWKTFVPFLINMWLSMPYNIKGEYGLKNDLLEMVSMIQEHTFTMKNPKHIYTLYLAVIPQNQYFFKYIKNQNKDKYNTELIKFISKYFVVSNKKAIDYLKIYYKDKQGINEVKNILKKYGLENKEIKKIMKIKK